MSRRLGRKGGESVAGPVLSAGEGIPAGYDVIKVHVGDLRQLFNAMDPSPFRDRDLDPNAEEFIAGWARELPSRARLALLVQIDRPGAADEPTLLHDAVRVFFSYRATTARQRLRRLLSVGRRSLWIGVLFLAISIVVGGLLKRALAGREVGELLRESLLIGGWVAMWRPLEIFLYNWWPILDEARLFDRLSAMPVRVDYPRAPALP